MESLQTIISKYLKEFPEDTKHLQILSDQIRHDSDLYSKENMNGHITASAFVLNDANEVLTIYHKKLEKYLQLGGHMDDADTSIISAAKREAYEEVGVEIELIDWHKSSGIPILIDPHMFKPPAHKHQSHHIHHDIMYVFKLSEQSSGLSQREVDHIKWFSFQNAQERPDWFITKTFARLDRLGIL